MVEVELQIRLLESLDLMLDFFGMINTGDQIQRSPAFPDCIENWLSDGNHNHLRLTRIMLSLWTLGCQKEALNLHDCLSQIADEFPGRISEETQKHWDEAVRL